MYVYPWTNYNNCNQPQLDAFGSIPLQANQKQFLQ